MKKRADTHLQAPEAIEISKYRQIFLLPLLLSLVFALLVAVFG